MTDTTTTAQPGAAAEGRTDNAMWSGRLAFILAATGSAVGLGNIWKFPYITGENGGAAFVLVYLLCIALIGLPIMIAEVTLGRAGRRSPINTMKMLASRDGNSPNWKFLGWMGMIASFLILSFYSVIGGWSLAYVGNAASGSFNGSDADSIGALFGGLLGSPGHTDDVAQHLHGAGDHDRGARHQLRPGKGDQYPDANSVLPVAGDGGLRHGH